MNFPKDLPSRFFPVTLLLLTAGCANVPGRQQALTATHEAVAPISNTETSEAAGVAPPSGVSQSSNAVSQSSNAPAIFPVAYTQSSEHIFPVEPLDASEGNLINVEAAWTLAEIEQFALANNPAISAADATSSKAAGLLRQVGVRPNPTVGYLGVQIADEGTDQHGLFVEQEFVRGKKLQLNREVLRHTTGAQRWEAEVQRNKVLTDIRVRYFEAAGAQLQLEAIDEFVEVASRGVQIASARLDAEEASKVDLLQAKIMFSEINLSRQQTQAAFQGAWKDLAAIAGMPATQSIELAGAFTPHSLRDWDSTYAEILARSPELTVANELVCEKRANLKRQKAQPTPNLMAGLGAGYDNGTGSGFLNVQLDAPIPVVNRNSGNIAAAYADYVRAVENVNRIQLAIRSRLARVAQEYESAIASVHQYEQEILPQAKESLTLSEEAYQAGELEFLQVLVVRRRYFDSTMAFIESQSHLAQADAKINGLLLTGGLDAPQDYTSGDELRGQSFGGE